MDLEETEISSQQIFQGRILDLSVRKIKLPNGDTATREIVKHRPASCLIAINDQQEILLIKLLSLAFQRTSSFRIIPLKGDGQEFYQTQQPIDKEKMREEKSLKLKKRLNSAILIVFALIILVLLALFHL